MSGSEQKIIFAIRALSLQGRRELLGPVTQMAFTANAKLSQVDGIFNTQIKTCGFG
jgi:hypothetical protein